MKVWSFFIEFRIRLGFTLFLILLEALLAILFPLFIGYAIDSAIEMNPWGPIQLGILGLLTLLVGVGRRVFDSRFYAKIYQKIGLQAAMSLEDNESSKKAARLGMIKEFVEFLENALPELIGSIIGLIGVIVIIATLNEKVFYGSILMAILVFILYVFTSSKTVHLNKMANDEYEKQVDVLSMNDEGQLKYHLKQVMKWNIKLSDLEATNYSISWFIMIGFLVASIIVSVDEGIVKYGALFSLIMYVFQYIEDVVNLPLYYQNYLRLREISGRLKEY